MWEGWKKTYDADGDISYELLAGSGIKVLLMVCLTRSKSDSAAWKVEIVAFNPGAGDYTLYEDSFSDFSAAEAKAWEMAQSIGAEYGGG